MCNADVRSTAKAAGVFLWEVAEELNVSEPTITRKLRHEMTQEEKNRFAVAIKKISERKREART